MILLFFKKKKNNWINIINTIVIYSHLLTVWNKADIGKQSPHSCFTTYNKLFPSIPSKEFEEFCLQG